MKRRSTRRALRVAAGGVLALVAVPVALWLYCVRMPGESLRGPLPRLSEVEGQAALELQRHVTVLAVDIGERRAVAGDSLRRAETYLHDELAPLTRLRGGTLRRERLTNSPGDAANLVLDLPGEQLTPLVLVGAHYDTAPSGTPGANDNASGSAAALVLARRLAGVRHRLPLRIVLFANEEMPYFATESMGSLQHARGCQQRGEQLRAMFSLETMGYYSDEPGSQRYPAPMSHLYPDQGNFIGFVGNLSSRTLVHEAVGRFRAHASIASEGAALPAELPGVGWSDHWSFWQVGYPAVMVTDTAPFRDPNYHRQSDTPEHLDFERLARVVIGLQATILELAER